MSLLPLYDKVIVRRAREESRTASGIEVVRRKEEMPDQGAVVAVGPKVPAEDIMEGDTVIFRQGAGVSIRHEGEELFALRAEDVYAVVEP